jgi:hypothetical protein
MSGPRDLTPSELARYGLGLVERGAKSAVTVIRIYCLHCGAQVPLDRRDVDPHGWWGCSRKCNTLYARLAPDPSSRPTP